MPALTKSEGLTLGQICELLPAEMLCGADLSVPISRIGAADLMSDVLALSQPGTLLLTGLVSPQVVRTAVILDLSGVVFVRGKRPGPDILALAKESNIPLFTTGLSMFEAAGRLYCALKGKP